MNYIIFIYVKVILWTNKGYCFSSCKIDTLNYPKFGINCFVPAMCLMCKWSVLMKIQIINNNNVLLKTPTYYILIVTFHILSWCFLYRLLILVLTLWCHLYWWRLLDQLIVKVTVDRMIGPSSAFMCVDLLFPPFLLIQMDSHDPSCFSFTIPSQTAGFLPVYYLSGSHLRRGQQ